MLKLAASDIVALALWYGLALATLGTAEWLHRRRGWPTASTRKLIHVTAGSSILFILTLFERPIVGLIPFGSFILINLWLHRRGSLRAMDSGQTTYGTVYFALSITVLLAWLWRDGPGDRSVLAAAAVMTMAWGDAAAALVGRWLGRHRYRVFGEPRSWEGSAAMFVVSAVASAVTLGTFGSLSPGPAIALSVGAAVAATIAEAIAPHGLDNLAVPLSAGIALVSLAERYAVYMN